MIKEDITERILGENADQAAAVFTMPVVDRMKDTTFDVGYVLKFTASYGDRVRHVELSGTGPTAGNTLPKNMVFTCDDGSDRSKDIVCQPSWSYIDADGDIVPASGKAYRDTIYIATFTLLPNEAKDILFDSVVEVSVDERLYDFYKPESIDTPVKRNPADGSITIRAQYPPTAKEGAGEDKPAGVKKKIKVGAWDLNLQDYDQETPFEEYSVKPGDTVEITAPNVPNEMFEQWDLGETGITLSPQEGNALTNKTILVDIPAALKTELCSTRSTRR